MITELAVFPQTAYTDGQGQVGTRKWVVDHNDDLDELLQVITASHWPGRKDCIATDVQCGAMHDSVVVNRACDSPRYQQTMGELPKYSKYQIVAHYKLFHVNDCWPEELGPKPYYPLGSTLSVNVKGGGQYILVTPASMKMMAPDALVCHEDGEGTSPGFLGKVRIPVAEYHLTCGRLTRTQVDSIFAFKHWDELLGCVNEDTEDASQNLFKAPPGTLVFDNYMLTQTDICDSVTPHRWQLTAILKRRSILDEDGDTLYDEDGKAIGWNYDYINIHESDKRWGWRKIKIWDEGLCRDRYPKSNFNDLFGEDPSEDPRPACNDETESPELIELTDTQFCHD